MSEHQPGRRMSPTDSILWRIERDPVLRSTVTAVSILDRMPVWNDYRQRMLDAADRIPWLRQVVVDAPLGIGSPSWVDTEDFDIDYHLRRVRLPHPCAFDELLNFAAREAMAEFDRARPPWEFTLVEGFDGDGAALIQKFHHAATDGVGAIRLAREILDPEREPQRMVKEPSSPRVQAKELRPPNRLESAVSVLDHATRRVAGMWIGMARSTLRTGRSPARTVRSAIETLSWGARLVAPITEPLSPVMRSRTSKLGFGAFDVDFEGLHDAAGRANGSLNDAFIAGVVAGLRRYHDGCGLPVSELRMTLPISVRGKDDALAGNRFVPVRFTVPVTAPDTATSVATISRLVREWRNGPALTLTDTLAAALNVLPTAELTQVFRSLLRNVDFVATNVPGLRAPAYLAGAKVLRQYAFAPPSGAAVNVALLSNVDCCCIGVNMDRGAIDDPQLLMRSLREGFEEVLALSAPADPSAHSHLQGVGS